jgi:hypothetical protein
MGDYNRKNFSLFYIGDSCEGGETELWYGSDCVYGKRIEWEDINTVFPYGYKDVPVDGYTPSDANDSVKATAEAYAVPGSLVEMFVANPNKNLRGAINEGATLFASGEKSKVGSIWGPAVAVFTKNGLRFK